MPKKLAELVLKKYALHEISLGRAVELSRTSFVDFMKLAAWRKIPINYSLSSLENDFKACEKI